MVKAVEEFLHNASGFMWGPWMLVLLFGTHLFLVIGMVTFVFSTILGWSYYGEKACEYLFGSWSIFPYRVVWVIAVLAGSVSTLRAVWDFADIANALMAIPNLVALLLLSPILVTETRRYLWEGGLDQEAVDIAEPDRRGRS